MAGWPWGSDRLWGGEGSDSLNGGPVDDYLRGEGGDDDLFGGFDLASDTLDGGPGNDHLDGGPFSDIYLFREDWGKDTLSDHRDPLDLYDQPTFDVTTDLVADLTPGPGPEVASGENTVDWERAGDVDQIVFGSGDDHIDAANGNYESINCGDGNDEVVAYDAGRDWINGDSEVQHPQ